MEKKFKPSLKRLTQARQKGDVGKGKYATACVSTGVGLLVGAASISTSAAWGRITFAQCIFQGAFSDGCTHAISRFVGWGAAVPLGAAAVSGLLCELIQVGWHPVPALALPNGARVAAGTARMIGSLKWWAPLLFLLEICLVLAVWTLIRPVLVLANPALILGENSLVSFIIRVVAGGDLMVSLTSRMVVKWLVVLLLAGAVVDIGITRWRYGKRHSMTLEEVRQEHKENEGNPQLKGQRRADHQALLLEGLEARVKRARVIITD